MASFSLQHRLPNWFSRARDSGKKESRKAGGFRLSPDLRHAAGRRFFASWRFEELPADSLQRLLSARVDFEGAASTQGAVIRTLYESQGFPVAAPGPACARRQTAAWPATTPIQDAQ